MFYIIPPTDTWYQRQPHNERHQTPRENQCDHDIFFSILQNMIGCPVKYTVLNGTMKSTKILFSDYDYEIRKYF